MKDCTQCKHLNKDCDKNYKTCIFYIQISMINKVIDDFNKKRRLEMTKITQDTELKVGMKVTFKNQIFLIYGMEEVPKKRFGLMDIETSLISVFNVQKCDLISILVRNKAEIIEENVTNNNAKIVVSELIARKLENAKKESIEIECGKFTVHCFAWIFLGKISNDDISKEELSFEKIVKICEGTTFDENGWEVEKPKRWRADECEKYYYVNPICGIGFYHETDSMIDCQNYDLGNYFKTKKDAEAKAKQIRDVFKGEE